VIGVNPSGMRVGLDLVEIARVAESVECFGERYINRIYTDHEIACCRRHDRDGQGTTYAMESLAARFAAKEAVVKVLRPGDEQPAWRSIELHRMTGGWCEIRLSGRAAELATEAGLGELSVSLSHETTLAAAVVVGWCTP
jgi:holo-[acyl-carrier protein] synthase